MLTRELLLESVNRIGELHGARKVGSIEGYRDQWLIGCHVDGTRRDGGQALPLHFCQGRNTGRINFNGGYEVTLDVTHCESVKDVLAEFLLLDQKKRREREKWEERCSHCAHYLRRLTGGCKPSGSCGYIRIPRMKLTKTQKEKEFHHGISQKENTSENSFQGIQEKSE